jgi:hypothetical protein
MDTGAPLDLQRKIIEELNPVSDVSTRLANQLSTLVSSKNVLEQVLLRSWLELVLKPLKEDVEEFL